MLSAIKKVVFVCLWLILVFSQINLAQAQKTDYREFSSTFILANPSKNGGKLPDNVLELVKPIHVENKESCKDSVLLINQLNIKRLDTGKKETVSKLAHSDIEKSYYAKKTLGSVSRILGKQVSFESFSDEMSAMLGNINNPILSEPATPSVLIESEFLNEFKIGDNKKLLIAPNITPPSYPNSITPIIISNSDDYKQKLTEQLCKSGDSSKVEFYVLVDSIVSQVPPIIPPYQIPPPPPCCSPPTNQDLFAIIEIGGSGIKPAILQMIYSREDDQYLVKEKSGIKDKKYDVIALDANNRGAFHPDSIPRIAEDLKEYISKFPVDYSVPKEHIYIVGSSGVAEATHREELQQAVQNATGITMDFVTAEQEGRLVFEGTIKQIPKEKGQQDRREKQAVVIDIGSSNTKGGYFDSSTGRVVKYGTKTFSQKIDAERGNNMPFADKAKELRDNVLRPAIRSEAIRVSGLKNQKRVYLIGGISWATSTLLSLDALKYASRSTTGDQEIYTVMNFTGLTDVNRLYNRVINPNAVEQVCNDNDDVKSMTDPEKKQKRLKDISNICNGIFNMDQLTGGLEILNAFALELNFNQKNVFFIQNVLNAWSVGYLKEKIERETSH